MTMCTNMVVYALEPLWGPNLGRLPYDLSPSDVAWCGAIGPLATLFGAVLLGSWIHCALGASVQQASAASAEHTFYPAVRLPPPPNKHFAQLPPPPNTRLAHPSPPLHPGHSLTPPQGMPRSGLSTKVVACSHAVPRAFALRIRLTTRFLSHVRRPTPPHLTVPPSLSLSVAPLASSLPSSLPSPLSSLLAPPRPCSSSSPSSSSASASV